MAKVTKLKIQPTPESLVEMTAGSRINLPPLETRKITIRLVGVTPLIVHRWSAKAREMILSKQTKKAVNKKEIRNPEADYRESLYMEDFTDRFGDTPLDDLPYQAEISAGRLLIPCFPSIAFKSAAVSACTSVSGVTKVSARQCFHVENEFIPIEGTPRMREDMVRIGMGTADLRYRAEFPEWSVSLSIIYNVHVLSEEQIVNLFNTAGFAVGIGEWRPERDGPYGRFKVDLG